MNNSDSVNWCQASGSELIDPAWRLYLSVNQAIIGSDQGLATDPCQAII